MIKRRKISNLFQSCNTDTCLLLTAAALLPFDKIFGSIAIILALIWAFYRILREKKFPREPKAGFWAMSLQALVIAVGIFFSQDKQEAWTFSTHAVSLIAFPLIFTGLNINRKQMHIVLWAFIIAYSIRALWLLGSLAVSFLENGLHKNWYFQEIGDLGGFHPTYMGLYSVIVIILLLYLYRNSIRYAVLGTGIFHFILIFILASRMALMALAMVALVLSLHLVKRDKGYFKKLVPVWLLAIVFTVILFTQNRDLQFKFAQLKNTSWTYNKYDAGSIATRVAKWQSALHIALRHPWTGAGTGDLPKALKKEFYKLDCLQCKVKKYNNPHNQFLDAFARNGAPGLFALLFFVLYGFFRSRKDKNVYFLAFMWVVSFMFLSECLLNREKGVEVIAFFYAAFLYRYIIPLYATQEEKSD